MKMCGIIIEQTFGKMLKIFGIVMLTAFEEITEVIMCVRL